MSFNNKLSINLIMSATKIKTYNWNEKVIFYLYMSAGIPVSVKIAYDTEGDYENFINAVRYEGIFATVAHEFHFELTEGWEDGDLDVSDIEVWFPGRNDRVRNNLSCPWEFMQPSPVANLEGLWFVLDEVSGYCMHEQEIPPPVSFIQTEDLTEEEAASIIF
jgi:hypothetical protein